MNSHHFQSINELMFTYVCLLIVIPCVKSKHTLSYVSLWQAQPSHSMTGRWPCQTRHTALTQPHRVTVQSSIYSATPVRGLGKDPWPKRALDQLFEQKRKSSGNKEDGTQMCTLAFKSTAHPWKHKSQEYQGGGLQDGTGPDHGCLYTFKGFWSSSEAYQEPSEQLEGSS